MRYGDDRPFDELNGTLGRYAAALAGRYTRRGSDGGDCPKIFVWRDVIYYIEGSAEEFKGFVVVRERKLISQT